MAGGRKAWALLSWFFNTVGIVLGMWWAYVELGWGGYWAWDPVENASLLPWPVNTAFLHSIMVQEKRGMLRKWNVTLVVSAFLLSIFGTFITRRRDLERPLICGRRWGSGSPVSDSGDCGDRLPRLDAPEVCDRTPAGMVSRGGIPL
jgi:hypothetical protein